MTQQEKADGSSTSYQLVPLGFCLGTQLSTGLIAPKEATVFHVFGHERGLEVSRSHKAHPRFIRAFG